MADNDKITELANRIYALDEKVYKATGSIWDVYIRETRKNVLMI